MDVLDRMGSQGHPEEDYLERYVMKVCSEQESDAIEAHLFGCEQCRALLCQAEEYVSLMKTVISQGPRRPRVSRWRQISELFATRPMSMAAGCAALAAVLISAPLLLRAPQEEMVPLTAMRGDSQTVLLISSGKLPRFKPDTADLTGLLEGQVVDSEGKSVMERPISRGDSDLLLPRKLAPGVYYVRINSREGDHANLREFQVRVK